MTTIPTTALGAVFGEDGTLASEEAEALSGGHPAFSAFCV
jgi:hypothetical protein